MPTKPKTQEQMRATWLRLKYGLTWKEYQAMLKAQKHRCYICKKKETRPGRMGAVLQLSVDHCHRTGQVRKLLCAACNMVLGSVDDNIEILTAMIAYLQEFA